MTDTSHTAPQSSSFEAEKILRGIMLRDRLVLSRRSDEPLTPRVLSDATREKLRAAGRRRQLLHKLKSRQLVAVSPVTNPRRTANG